MLDETHSATRRQYVSTILAVITNIEDWLAIDSWLGGGRVNDTELREEFGEAFSAFRAVSTVVCMAAELAEAAVLMVEKHRFYAVVAVIRQLIECEYLLALFNEDLDYARRWRESTPDEVRESFTPAKMRKLVGKFSNEEYWNHCSTGADTPPRRAPGCSRSSTRLASRGRFLPPSSRPTSASTYSAFGRPSTHSW